MLLEATSPELNTAQSVLLECLSSKLNILQQVLIELPTPGLNILLSVLLKLLSPELITLQSVLLLLLPNLVQVFHEVFPARLQVSNEGRLVAHSLEVFQVQGAASLPRHGQQMQHCIGAASKGHDGCHGILKGLLGHDV